MITCLAIGDPHFKASNIQECREAIRKLLELIHERKPTFVVCLGDVLHTHEKIHVEALCTATYFIKEMGKIVPTYVIIGNHDRPNNSDFLSDKHAFNGLKGLPNIHIIDTTTEFTVEGLRFVGVPYVFPGRFMEALNHIEDPLKDTSCIFAHQEFLGARMGAIESIHGDPWQLDAPLVISGHIHDFDQLQLNLIYPGALMQHAFGDREDKTVSWLTFDKDDDGQTAWDHERIDLHLLKRKIVRIKFCDLRDDWQPPTNCLVKVVLLGTDAELKTAMKHPKVLALKEQGVKIAYKSSCKGSQSPLKTPTPHKTYLQSLYDEILTNESLVGCYREVFG